ncbi:hypothetical protein Nisw_02775 [Candidatus Nitrosopumilus sp. SW]|uniref:S8 family peptidase n=1 Tax=Candidatus Nitrosopumilus sp. SW TaxID=2508726 RepID=UPI00114E9561|nr:S8 family serine peptidase [Candidatus Nitrosopumilus sp. SW]QDI88532.1 hypothetical protein Nisw_02775 [Candidatus Nitrosopumilus sp. SW]
MDISEATSMVKSLQYFAVIGLFSILLSSGIAINVSALPEHVPNIGRFVTPTTDSSILEVYESKGCSVKYVFEEMSALDCPPSIGRLMGLQQDIEVFALDITANAQIKATNVQTTGLSGSGVTVAVLDTGIDSTHTELSSSIVGGKSFVDYTTSYDDDHGHGTFVSGLITSDGIIDPSGLGSAPNAQIWVGKVLGPNGGYLSDTVAAINHVVANSDADVISMSLGSVYPNLYKGKNCDRAYPAMTNAVENAISNGVTVVAAAGNDGSLGVPIPGCISDVITVGAIDSTDSPAYFTGTGRSVDVVALGVNDYSTMNGGGYGIGSGTSFSTPVVSGVIALMIENDSTLSPLQIQEALRNTAVDIGSTGFDSSTGYGKVDALAAINYSPGSSDGGDDSNSDPKCSLGKQKRNLC